MDPASISLILALVSEGVGVAKELAALATRIQNGEAITEDEVKAAREEISDSIKGWGI